MAELKTSTRIQFRLGQENNEQLILVDLNHQTKYEYNKYLL